ncbi:MAG: hypothetical protein KME28_25030 [Pelatocladus maniniholoensis HA4357-MV3]|jgi:hypothetical protein|uniref:Uncharacterized protein n=1 Tax=Pelatocladus maniniholoensis HA4357-MV3 TaxID=1117104 RepID=A0A9E3HCY1_9NOST|nr:hypothetical protein [Pelatocladus maniniholoensis HA4357-MV3]BAZ70167.1 hypothetical protein NIES4106_49540 [Fischerella sp. NIES-4106]
MLKRLIQWLKRFFQRLLGNQKAPAAFGSNHLKEPPPPLSDTDLEFLFTELLEGVNQARGQHWALKWLHNIEHRVSTERWIEWLHRFGEKLLASPSPNTELAARMVQLGELEVGEVGDAAHNIGMQLLARNQGEPVWEYEGPDVQIGTFTSAVDTGVENFPTDQVFQAADEVQNLPEGEFQTVTLDELLILMQQDDNLREMIAQQLGIETEDPQTIIQALIDQFHAANQSTTEQG